MTDDSHAEAEAPPRHLLFWGTYDRNNARIRILLSGLAENGVRVSEIHTDVWGGVWDKTQMTLWGRLWKFLRLLLAYPGLVIRFFTAPRPDAVVVGHPGHLDILMLQFPAALRGIPIVWDMFLSAYDTLVLDRQMVKRGSFLAGLIHGLEGLVCRSASGIVMDTAAHAVFIRQEYDLSESHVGWAPVGAEDLFFHQPIGQRPSDVPRSVLFYGKMIPLHGISTILEAAHMTAGEGISWTIIGTGQEVAKVHAALAEGHVPGLQWRESVSYTDLPGLIDAADICLGVFGGSDKAGRVVPNKVYQALARGCPVITRDSPAMRALTAQMPGFVMMVPPESPQALAVAIVEMLKADRRDTVRARVPAGTFDGKAVARQFSRVVEGSIR
ncbi:MAG: glycosyltransferase [Magnetospiraceae bacterium]